jgi:enoyl-[acyl-carrier protein] reductase II
LKLSAIDGDTSDGSVMAGQVSGLLKKEQSAAEIILELESDYQQTFERLQKFKPIKL